MDSYNLYYGNETSDISRACNKESGGDKSRLKARGKQSVTNLASFSK